MSEQFQKTLPTRNKPFLSWLVAIFLVGCGISTVSAQSGLDQFDAHCNGPICLINTVVVQADGKILVGGRFTNIGGQDRSNIARLDPVSGLADSFNPAANGDVSAVVLQPDGKILVGGAFGTIGGSPRSQIARLDPTTGLVDSFNPSANGDVRTILLQPDGMILVGGLFTNIGGQNRGRIARLDPATGLADNFNPNANSFVATLFLQPDGRILVGGSFNTVGGQSRTGMARLNPETGLADSFDPRANFGVFAIATQPDGKILAGGDFTKIGGQPRKNIARLDPVTGLPDAYNLNMQGINVRSIVSQDDGRIIVGGSFFKVGSTQRYGLARLYDNGRPDSFDPKVHGDTYATAVQADGKILVVGEFSSVGPGQAPRRSIARFQRNAPLPVDPPAPPLPVPFANGKIAFNNSVLPPSSPEVFLVDPNGSNLVHFINQIPNQNLGPVWSPDGQKILTYGYWGLTAEIFVMDADGRNQIALTHNGSWTGAPIGDRFPKWSPDGSKIAFARCASSSTPIDNQFQIYVMNADGSNSVRLTDTVDASNVFPTWSPDGTRIAFSRGFTGGVFESGTQIWVMNADGSNQVQLTFEPGYNECPAWSPDGTKIAFDQDQPNATSSYHQIFVMDPNGRNQFPLPDAHGYAPVWSPDGKKIAFTAGGSAILIADWDGSHLTYFAPGSISSWQRIPLLEHPAR